MIKIYSFGVLAQLGARRTGSAKVTGSSPVYSTTKKSLGNLVKLGVQGLFYAVFSTSRCKRFLRIERAFF